MFVGAGCRGKTRKERLDIRTPEEEEETEEKHRLVFWILISSATCSVHHPGFSMSWSLFLLPLTQAANSPCVRQTGMPRAITLAQGHSFNNTNSQYAYIIRNNPTCHSLNTSRSERQRWHTFLETVESSTITVDSCLTHFSNVTVFLWSLQYNQTANQWATGLWTGRNLRMWCVIV